MHGETPNLDRPAVVLWNPAAGGAADALDVRKWFEGQRDVEIIEAGSEKEARRAAAAAARRDVPLIVAAGGDGTANTVARGMLSAGQCTSELGVVPLGTANDLAKSLGLFADVQRALTTLSRGRAMDVDVVRTFVDSHETHVINCISSGNSAGATEKVTDEMKQKWGPMSYVRGAAEKLAELRSYDLRIQFDDDPPQHFDAWAVLSAGGRYSGNVEVAPRASLQDGLIDVIVIPESSLAENFNLLARFLLSDYTESDRVEYRRCRHVRIEAAEPVEHSLDGNVAMAKTVEGRVEQAALRVLHPADAPFPETGSAPDSAP